MYLNSTSRITLHSLRKRFPYLRYFITSDSSIQEVCLPLVFSRYNYDLKKKCLEYKTNSSSYKSFYNSSISTKVIALFALISYGIIKSQEVFCKEGENDNKKADNNLSSTLSSAEKNDDESFERNKFNNKLKENSTSKDDKKKMTLPPLDNKENKEELPSLPKSGISKKNDTPQNPILKDFSGNFYEDTLTLKYAIVMSRSLLIKKTTETGAPGIIISVSVDGKNVWNEGIGYRDFENAVKMDPYTVIRIASISKSITMAVVAQLIEEGKLDLDAPIQKYVPTFPQKFVNGEEVTITTRHLLSHTSGIRHYSLKEEVKLKDCNSSSSKTLPESKKKPKEKLNKDLKEIVKEKRENIKQLLSEKIFPNKSNKNKTNSDKDEFDLEEYYIKEHFDSVKEALKLFQDDDLFFKPGEKFLYTTHGWTLVSAVIEGASGKTFNEVIKNLFDRIGLSQTYFEVNDDIIYNRARYYVRNKRSILKNAPYVDNSYKWAGGGFLSTVVDLTKFGNSLLYSYQVTDEDIAGRGFPHGFLKSATMKEMWRPVENTKMDWDKKRGAYALGWGVVEAEENPPAFCNARKFYVSHTGGAVGASSVLLIYPRDRIDELDYQKPPPQGIVVAIVTNMQSVGLNSLALQIANYFRRVQQDSKVLGSIRGSTKNKVFSLDSS